MSQTSELANCLNAQPCNLLLCHSADAPEATDWQWIEEVLDPVGVDDNQRVRLPEIARQLREELVGSNAHGCNQPKLTPDVVFNLSCDAVCSSEEGRASGHIEEGLIKG